MIEYIRLEEEARRAEEMAAAAERDAERFANDNLNESVKMVLYSLNYGGY